MKNRGGEMIPEADIFSVSGPSYLTYVDWNCASHRRTVIASLVKGAYVSELDRQKNRHGTNSVASPWWEFFHFHLHKVLTDSRDSSIFGVVLELKLPPSLNAPKYVIAFRGTLIKPKTGIRDLLLDLNCTHIVNTLNGCSRFQHALPTIHNMVELAGGADNVWLAGHSLGSAIALLAGKNMAKKGYFLPTYLFNSPFTSAPFEKFNHEKINRGIHLVGSVAKVGLCAAFKSHHLKQQDEVFDVLSEWVPYLFVNPADHICSGYINYFAHRDNMEKNPIFGKIEKIATKCTVTSLISDALDRDSEPNHLIPSAELIENTGQSPNFIAAHEIKQWWNPTLQFQTHMYRYK